MNITELDSFNLADAVKFNDQLNPRIWQGQQMRPEVREKLLEIAADFKESLGLTDLEVKDITVSGSNAGYTYTPYSDIDLHLVVDIPLADQDEVYRELFDAKKFQYNELHNIKIGGYDVELYVENANKPPVSQGVFSVLNNDWIHIPRQRKATVNDDAVRSKYEDLKHRIDSAVSSNDTDKINALAAKIKTYRQAGLDKHGELGPENLSYKMLRNQGYIEKLYKARTAARDAELSLAEQNKVKKPFVYGHTGMAEDATTTPDGVNPTTQMFLNEEDPVNDEDILKDFIDFVAKELKLNELPIIKLRKDPQWSVVHKTFGRYLDDRNMLEVAWGQRHIMDVLRTVAHELTHRRQHEREDVPLSAGETGSPYENEANARAGILMRDYARLHPEYFEAGQAQELHGDELKEASGYIPTRAQAQDPRFKMALTVDVHPGETGKQANKMALKTDSQGKPGLLMKTVNLREGKIKLSTDPNWYGAEVGDYKASGPVVNIPANRLVGFEPDDKMNQPASKANVEKIVAGLKQGAKLPPLLVRQYKNGYQVLDGHHRFWAYKLLGVKSIPAQVVPAEDVEEVGKQGVAEATRYKGHGYGSKPMSQVPGGIEDELGNQEATGPEFEPQFPEGTTKVDVSDLTDWYRLGMDISDMDDADPEDYNQGPPQTVIVFPSDEAEQGYLKQFKRLGLKTHDLDPDVEGGEDKTGKHMHEALAEELAAFKEQDLFEVKMTNKNLEKLANDIKGVKVGLEFEMYIPSTYEDEDYNSDLEADYDQDQRVRDIDDAVNFFDDGDYNSRNEIRSLRSSMYDDYHTWVTEQIDDSWYNSGDGFDYFKDYLDREEPFDEEEAEEEARNELQTEYGDTLDTEEFEKMMVALVEEKRESYAQEQWDEQGRNFDYAREEYEQEQRDNYSEQDWLESSMGIRFASDVESNYGNVTWPYYTSNDSYVKRVALKFMNESGLPYDNIAVSDRYHGRYELWDGDRWTDYGSEKPDFCFTVEPDGSLDEPNNRGDVGLEFVSPPVPLDQINNLMSKVQQWAGRNGVYTGKVNKTALHTNISIPGYSIENLDYLKAALLLGDEHVLREFDRIGNTYAEPAIEKVRELVKQKPEKAKQLLDKMKSQLNAEASKLLHSGQTNKFTSINTKDNRIEFRSPGGDYLNDIAEKPKKMQDTINRMVVAMDAAMDPNKYKEEYQKKLYKMLTGQQSGREAETGKKREPKKNTNDLLNIFSRYAAGELPQAALKSFLRQAQFQRNAAKGKETGKMWWNVEWDNGRRMEVVASSEQEAKDAAAQGWGIRPGSDVAQSFTAKPLRPYEEKSKGPELNGRPSNPDGDWVIIDTREPNKPVYRFMASDNSDAFDVLRQWISANPGGQWNFARDANQRLGQPGEQSAQQGTTVAGRPNNPEGDWYLKNGDTNEIFYRFNAADYADAYSVLQQWRQENPDSNINAMYGYGRDEPAQQDQGNYIGIRSSVNRDQFRRGPDGEVLRFPSVEQAYGYMGRNNLDRSEWRISDLNMVDDNLLQTQAPAQTIDTPGNFNIEDPTTGNIVSRLTNVSFRQAAQAAEEMNSAQGRGGLERFVVRQGQWQPAQQNQDNWGIWIDGNSRFANQPGTYARDETPPLIRFPSQEAAEQWIEQQRAERPNMRTDIEVREIEPTRQPAGDINLFPEIEPIPGSTLDLQRQRADQASSARSNLIPHGPGPWELASMANNQVYFNPTSTDRQTAEAEARTWIQQMGLDPAEFVVRTRETASNRNAAQGGIINTANEPTTGSEVGQTYHPSGTGSFTGQWLILNPDNRVIYRFGGIGNSQSDANRHAMNWLSRNPRQMVDGVTVVPEMG